VSEFNVPQERSHRQALLGDIYLTLSREMNQNRKDSEMWMEVKADSGLSLVQCTRSMLNGKY
jgi:hypothetical protein